MLNSPKGLLHFEEFSLDLEKKILWFGDECPDVPTKAVEVLCALAEERGEVVSRDALLEKVWSDAFVEEGVLTQNIYVLRKLFKERGVSADLIRTVPRRGYRFHAEPITDSGEFDTVTIERSFVSKAHMTEIESSDRPAAGIIRPFRYARAIGASMLVLLAVAVLAAFYPFSSGDDEPSPDGRIVMRYEPLSASGRALYAGLSPSGDYAGLRSAYSRQQVQPEAPPHCVEE